MPFSAGDFTGGVRDCCLKHVWITNGDIVRLDLLTVVILEFSIYTFNAVFLHIVPCAIFISFARSEMRRDSLRGSLEFDELADDNGPQL